MNLQLLLLPGFYTYKTRIKPEGIKASMFHSSGYLVTITPLLITSFLDGTYQLKLFEGKSIQTPLLKIKLKDVPLLLNPQRRKNLYLRLMIDYTKEHKLPVCCKKPTVSNQCQSL